MRYPFRIAITAGEPAGIGPDIVIKLAQQAQLVELVVIADRELLRQRAKQLGLPLTLISYNPKEKPQAAPAGCLKVYHVPLSHVSQSGILDPANAHYVLNTLEIAAKGCMTKEFTAVVTGPVHKGVINAAGIAFSGHTEFFQAATGADQVVMMLTADKLRVALVTTHLPLHQVAAAITPERLQQTVLILHASLREKFGIAQPRIAVCGLNPHAGEHGYMGSEEITIITPVLEQLRQQYGFELLGPLAADTLFVPQHLDKVDAVLAMYHDQGLPVLKYQGFGKAVNITLGLPIIRTSVDHGTALALAGTGQAKASSLQSAINQTLSLVKNSAQQHKV